MLAGLWPLAAILSVQLSTALSRPVMAEIGVTGTVWLRLVWAGLFLALLSRPKILLHSRAQWAASIMLGLTTAGMTLAYFAAVDRMPIGLATSIDYLGPLAIAVGGLRRARDLLWTVLAIAGVGLVLRNEGGWAADPIGVACAGLSAIGWAGYIILTKRVGRLFPGMEGLAIAIIVAAIALAVPAVAATPIWTGHAVAETAGLAVLAPLATFSLEMVALRRMAMRTFGILMSVEPAVSALIGYLVLDELLEAQQIAGILFVTIASIGAVTEERRQPAEPS
jgi:inner membrane transporter RhtA